MIYIESPSYDPMFNLALEQYVFDQMDKGKEYVILWQNQNTVVIGKNQNAFSEINQKIVQNKSITVVRRLSGGGAVYHDLGNINYSLILNAEDTSNLDVKRYCQEIANFLQSLGVPAEVNGRNDILVGGKKVSGNAQYIKQNRVLHHGTLLFNSNFGNMEEILSGSKDKYQSHATKSVKSRVVNIAPLLPVDLSLDRFKSLLREHLVDSTSIETHIFSEAELEVIETIRKEKYATWEWTYGYSPEYNVKKVRRFEDCGSIETYINVQDGYIADIHFFGDYFGLEDTSKLSELLKGVRLEYKDLRHRLEKIDINRYFLNLTKEQFLEILL